jgi:predicted phage terminase large subunit-like protein
MRSRTDSEAALRAAAGEMSAHRKRAREHLLDFTTYTKPDYQASWHHRALCEVLDRFVAGDITRLMVSMPPRHGKSELVSRRLPAYLLGRDPDANVIACSYSADLASSMNRDVQRIIDSPAYHRLFPSTTLYGSNIRTTAQGAYLRNSDIFEVVGHTGVYRSAGVGGGITGMGADFGIIDDPVKNQEEAASPTYRSKVWEWYTTTLYTRLEEADSRILLTMTRWHEDDLAGRLIKAAEKEDGEKWEIICLPALAEGPRDPRDPRREGEPLWPEKFPASRLAAMKITLGTYPWSALYQQAPAPAGGGLFKREWFRYLDHDGSDHLLHTPAGDRRVKASDCVVFQTCDPAGSTKSSADYFVLGTWAVTPSQDLLLLDILRRRLEGPDQPALFHQGYARWRPALQGVEARNTGLTLFQQLERDGLPVVELKPDTDKFTRALPMAARYEAGCVYHLAGAPWLVDYELELVNFPGAAHDDQVDVAAYAYLIQQKYGLGIGPFPDPVYDDRSEIPDFGGDYTTIPGL